MKSINPTTGEVIRRYPEPSAEEGAKLIEQSHQVFLRWRTEALEVRSRLMSGLAALLRSKADRLGHLMALEMGKALREGRAEIEKCAWVCDYYSENAEEFLRPEHIETDARKSYVAFCPIGVVLAVMPWNFPFWQVFRFAAPALMAGNVGVLKHASNVPGCAVAIEELFLEAGFPEGAFRTLLVGVGCRGHLPITTSYRFASAHLLSSFQNFVSAAMRIAWKRRLDDTWDRQNLLEAKSGFEPVDADEGKCPDGK